MATGDISDIQARLIALLPADWFSDGTSATVPVLNAITYGIANALAPIYSLIVFAKKQMRFATMSGGFLDLANFDYLGYSFLRLSGESDANFSARTTEEILRVRNTRYAIEIALVQLTQRAPQIFEPWNVADTGAIGRSIFLSGATPYPPPFVGIGCVGNTSTPYTVFVIAYRPMAVSGLTVRDAQIYSAVNRVRSAGVTVWVSIQN